MEMVTLGESFTFEPIIKMDSFASWNILQANSACVHFEPVIQNDNYTCGYHPNLFVMIPKSTTVKSLARSQEINNTFSDKVFSFKKYIYSLNFSTKESPLQPSLRSVGVHLTGIRKLHICIYLCFTSFKN